MAAKSDANTELERYVELTPKSRDLWEEAQAYMPGGDTRNSVFWEPYPIYIEHGEGCHTLDVDGTDRLDFIGNMTTLILGNAYPPIVEAVQTQASHGLVYNAPNRYQIRLAKLLCERVPSLDLVRFTNSGTEGTLNAIRAAMSVTGRSKIAKCEGGYHGSHDIVSVSVRNVPEGPPERPAALPSVGGLPKEVVEHVVVVPFNDTDASREILEENRDDLAAVIIEPVLGGSGMVAADRDYLAMLREFTERTGSVLIFDEVISFRVAAGGAQEYYGVTPDMTTFGKVIGGGFPVGAFGGRRDLMELFDPTKGPVVSHAGTFNGNPLTMLAGSITMEHLTPEVYQRLDTLTERLRYGVREVGADLEVPLQVTGIGSLFGIHLTDVPVRGWREVSAADKDLTKRMFWGLMNEGILFTNRMVGGVSNAMGEAEIDTFVQTFRQVLERNLPA